MQCPYQIHDLAELSTTPAGMIACHQNRELATERLVQYITEQFASSEPSYFTYHPKSSYEESKAAAEVWAAKFEAELQEDDPSFRIEYEFVKLAFWWLFDMPHASGITSLPCWEQYSGHSWHYFEMETSSAKLACSLSIIKYLLWLPKRRNLCCSKKSKHVDTNVHL